MKLFGRPLRAAWTAALAAVALLSYASVTSVVMQAAMARPADAGMSMPGMDMAGMSMPGMDMAGMDGGQGGPAPAKGKADVCAFCSTAHHAPTLSATPPLPAPSVVAWLVLPRPEATGERGPPSFRANARGPPSPLQLI